LLTQGCIYLIKNTVETVIVTKLLQFKITVLYFNMTFSATLCIFADSR